jgi:phospholipid transport system substrate-binding protein
MTARMDIGHILQYATNAEFREASPRLQQQLRISFANFLAEAYSPRIEAAAGLTLVVSSSRSASANAIVVSTTFAEPGRSGQQIDWELEPSGNTYRIVDVASDGVSLLEIQRSSIVSVMRDGGLPNLLTRINARTQELAAGG